MFISKRKVANLTDEEFETLTEEFNDKLDIYIKEMAENYVAYYISLGYNLSALVEGDLAITAFCALDSLSGTMKKIYDIDNVKKILEDRYSLRIINDNTMAVIEVKG